MKPSHPFVSCGTDSENYEEAFRNHVKKLTTPIFQKVLDETRFNQMSGRGEGVKNFQTVRVRPHNYRLFFDFKDSFFVPPDSDCVIEPTQGVGMGYKNIVSRIYYRVINYGSTHEFTSYYGCRIVVRRKTVEICPVDFTKDSFYIELSGQEKIERDLIDIFMSINMHCLDVLKCFFEDFGGSSDFVLQSSNDEVKVDLETGINRISRSLKFHAPLVKKVYNENNVEFKDPLSAVNFLQNRALEDFSPIIANAINGLAETLGHPLSVIKSKISCYDDIVKLKNVIGALSEEDRFELSIWIAERGVFDA